MEFTYWFLLPIAVVIAAIANGAGIGGATFFSPLFILVLGLEPQVAIGVALITEVFGFASGVTAHARARTIDWKVARMLAIVSIPTAVIGSLLAGSISPDLLKIILGLGLAVIAIAFIRHRDHESEDAAISRGENLAHPAVHRVVITRQGERIEYQLCRRNEGRWFAGLGGLFVGLISTGLGELNSYALVMRCRIPTRVTVAISVVVVAVTALAAGVTHVVGFLQEDASTIDTVLSIVIFTVPGVLIGGQLGPQITSRVPEKTLLRSLGWLFALVAVLTLGEVFFGG
jgi:uncharacterized membrane protein YfcA